MVECLRCKSYYSPHSITMNWPDLRIFFYTIFFAQKGAPEDTSHPLNRLDYGGCVLGNEVLLLGGMTVDANDQVYLPGLSLKITPLANVKFYFHQVSIFNDLWRFSLTSRRWDRIAEECTQVSERCNHLCLGLDEDRMLVHGGDCMGPLGKEFYIFITLFKRILSIFHKMFQFDYK